MSSATAGKPWLPLILAAPLALAAIPKLLDPRGLQAVIDHGVAGAPGLAAILAAVLPTVEVQTFVCACRPAWQPWGLLQAWILYGLFAGWQAWMSWEGSTGCGCFGTWLELPPIAMLVLDAALFAAVALVLVRFQLLRPVVIGIASLGIPTLALGALAVIHSI